MEKFTFAEYAVKVIEAGKGTLVCCGKPMKLMRS
ncbi:MAG: hypothetical protein QXZ53_04805 [Candidatus Bathyarchaeia archaeon]